MKLTLLLAASMLAIPFATPAAGQDTRVFEMRTYFATPGKLEALHARFRDHTVTLFEKHGMTNIGYWVPIENPDIKLIYVLAYPSRAARETSWQEFQDDASWKKAKADSEQSGPLVTKVEQLFLSATSFSPEIKPSVGAGNRVFELRTYTTTPGHLALLHARFRDYTMRLFARAGMTNLFYWQLLPDQPNAENTLIYMLGHDSEEAAEASFKAFRADPEWIAARKASEEQAGGSLTVPDGVKSLFLKATDYSPTH